MFSSTSPPNGQGMTPDQFQLHYQQQSMLLNLESQNLDLQNKNQALYNAKLRGDKLELENTEKAKRIQKEDCAEDAYSTLLPEGGGLCVPSKTGTNKLVLGSIPKYIYHVEPDSLFDQEPYYCIQFSNGKDCVIPDSIMFHDRKLFAGLAQATGSGIRHYTSRAQTAELLREYIFANTKCIALDFYYGWNCWDDQWKFRLCNEVTHSPPLPWLQPENISIQWLAAPSKTTVLEAASQVVRMFSCIRNPDIRNLLLLWWHCAALYSLLFEEEMAPEMGLCLCCQGGISRKCLEQMLCWYGDDVISLSTEEKRFLEYLIERKDQPLVLSDHNARPKNLEQLSRILEDRMVPVAPKKGEDQPLQALPTLLSAGDSPLCCGDAFLTVELEDSDWCPTAVSDVDTLSGYLDDYREGFLAYTSSHIRLLFSDFQAARSAVEMEQWDDLSARGLQTLISLNCIQRFLTRFWKHLNPPKELEAQWQALLSEDDAYLAGVICQACTSGDDLGDMFVSISRHMVRDGSLAKVPVERVPDLRSCVDASEGTVFCSEAYWYFDRSAFRKVAVCCNASTTKLLHALKENGLLKGKAASKSSAMTRITVRGREIRQVRVYALERTLFEDAFFDMIEEENG